jgi:hypothetical protein
MDDKLVDRLVKSFPEQSRYQKIVVWNIPDIYTYQPIPELVKIILNKYIRNGI